MELFYLHHRFSSDLDFFSSNFNEKEIESITSEFKKQRGMKVRLISEMILPGRARVKFFSVKCVGTVKELKIDFVEDVLSKNPNIKHFSGVPVYSAQDLYYQKISTIAGAGVAYDETGRELASGRNQARDAFDVYCLSRQIMPLSVFLKKLPPRFQRGMVSWHQSFSRQDLKLSLLDLDIYDKNFDSREMISYLDGEIKEFMKGVLQ